MNFKIGDKVQAISSTFTSDAVGTVVKVVPLEKTLSGKSLYGVMFNRNEVSPESHFHLHNLDGFLEQDSGRWFYTKELILVEEEVDEL